MRFSGSFAARVAVVVALLASVASASAFDDPSFFSDYQLTLADVSAADRFASSSVSESYSGCLGCAAAAAEDSVALASPVYAEPFFAAPVVYDAFPTFTTFQGAGYSYVYDSWVPERRRPIKRFLHNLRPARRVLSRVYRTVRRDFNFCRPAYVCDPCWSCADFCDPCVQTTNFCDPCVQTVNYCDPCAFTPAPVSVYAPRPCCGYGYYPGEVNELDPNTGLAKEKKNPGIAAAADSDAPAKTSSAPAVLSTDDAEPAAQTPTLKSQYDRVRGLDAGADDAGAIDNPLPEDVPTPAPDLKGSGVIRMIVPEQSVVYVNGYRTKQKGAFRSFAARELEIGQTYTFEVRVVALVDGEVREEVKTATLVANATASLAFDFRNDEEVYAFNR